ncbi:hypothetical protein WKH56_19575 [Priestia sp. SB1]|uniref:hypothetical protein n=1 Tax=Priestia sp. SB1 TaxID=3132359 RepID=UPI003172FD9C
MINYNGKEFEGNNITINQDGVFIDGKKVDTENMHFSTFTHETVTNHYYKKEDKKKKSKLATFKTELWDVGKFMIISAIIVNLLWGFSTEENPLRNSDVIIACLLTHLFVTRKKK